jgi:long-subunit fatty acid transport protein
MKTSNETDFGYLVGVAWEKPEIAARVSLTYNSKITHDFDASENSAFGSSDDQFSTTVPESVNLEFQTGIAKDTLLMGSVRWVHWTQFEIAPDDYSLYGQGPLVDYKNNTTTWSLGVGRRFNDQWSGALMFGYEKQQAGTVGNLAPTDGFKSVSLAASYEATDQIKITGGVRYVDIGDATTSVGSFSDNSGWGAGVRLAINF